MLVINQWARHNVRMPALLYELLMAIGDSYEKIIRFYFLMKY